ncbi:heparan-alpha-glucosaminide N-acetyltransferase [Labilibacter sediminis]|nr:heparan-alpha-glucosaminide N-acetyltransferase [Labilibacter sediminis]
MKERLLALDAMRGYTIAAMILVSTPATWEYVYIPVTHANWNNTTPTDLIFPFFIFMVGISIAISLGGRKINGILPQTQYPKIVLRFVKIMGVGILLNMFPSFDFLNYGWSGVGYTGVLARISIVYLVCALLFLHTNWRKQLLVGAFILVGYWLCMYLIPVPGTVVGVLEPGQNVAHWIDSYVLSLNQGQWVPEGFFSTFPAIVTGILGMLSGTLLTSSRNISDKVIWLFFLGFTNFLIGSIWSWQFPLNKNIWSSSFVLYSGGLAMLTLAASMFVIDHLGYKKGTKMGIVFGSNAITMYVLFHILHPVFLDWKLIDGQSTSQWFFSSSIYFGVEPKLASLLYAILYTVICYIPAYWMYKRKIFIKL